VASLQTGECILLGSADVDPWSYSVDWRGSNSLRSVHLSWLDAPRAAGTRAWERHCVAGLARRLLVGGGEGREWAEYTSNKAASVCCDRCDTELMQPITACAGRCGHAVASVGAVRALSRDSHRRCALFVECTRVAVNSLVYDIVRYLGATIIAGLPHPRSISRYRLIDKNPSKM